MLIVKKLLRRLLLGLVVAIGVLWLTAFALQETGQIHTYVVPSSSMSPTLKCGDHVVAVRYLFGAPARNDVVIFRMSFYPAAFNPNAVFIKRVVGVGGDRIEVRDGHLFVNGHVADTDPLNWSDGPHTVKAGWYFVLGDQRDVSDDSRVFGDVPRSAIIGRAVAVYWPLGHLGQLAGRAPSDRGSGTC